MANSSVTTNERISVIIPVYNAQCFLAEALRSVLDQTLPPDEVIVVDDGSTDGSAEIVAQIKATSPVPIQLIQQSNQGPSAARNAGLQRAVGSFIAFQDADDIWSAEKLATQVAFFRRHPQACAVIGYSQIALTDPNDTSVMRCQGRPGPILLLQESLFRCAIFELVGRFDPCLRGDEDVEWFLHLLDHPVEIVIHPDVVLTYRRHGANLTGSLAASRRQLLLALRRSVVRRRQMQQGNSRMATVTFVTEPTSGRDEGDDEST
jgi:glycosyltransferase involved in cell wall biosynthesis